jgi:prevent-host-death family protein
MQVDIEKIIPVTEARDSFNRIVDEVEGSDELYVLTKNGKPAAVVVGVNHLEKLTGESEMEVMAKVESKPEAPDAAPTTGGTTLKPFQINNYDNIPTPQSSTDSASGAGPAPTTPADTSVTPPAPAPASAPDVTPTPAPDIAPTTPDASASAPRSLDEVGPYDPFKIPEEASADTSTPTPSPDPMATPPAAPDTSTPAPTSDTPPPSGQAM